MRIPGTLELGDETFTVVLTALNITPPDEHRLGSWNGTLDYEGPIMPSLGNGPSTGTLTLEDGRSGTIGLTRVRTGSALFQGTGPPPGLTAAD